jgi:hypothetical protein
MMELNKRIKVIQAIKLLASFDLEQQALFNYVNKNPEGLDSMALARKILHDEVKGYGVQEQ